MIKRLRFATAPTDLSPDALQVVAGAPTDVRPLRVTRCTALPGLTGAAAHERVAVEWFADAAHLARYEAWAAGRVDRDGCSVVVAEERVVRGADWLEERWRHGGERFEHLSLAVRAAGLSPEELSARWRAHAGTAGATPIPDEARGLAYVQDHPCRPSAYDAVSEAWFDDVEALQARIDWFQANGVGAAPDDLFASSSFLAVRESVVLA